MSIRREVLARLSDGGIHSGAALGQALGVTRAAVHRQIGALVVSGVPVESLRGRGYRLRETVVLLDPERIRAQLDDGARASLREIEVFERVDSTSARLLEHPDPRGVVYLAEFQSAGRGRRGRVWHASAFGNLLFSVGWSGEGWPGSVTALSLGCAVAVARGLERCGVAGVGIKWPNDIVCRERKLAGILIDAAGESAGSCRLVVGVGVNVRMAGTAKNAIDRAWTDISAIAPRVPDRNRMAAVLISEILQMLGEFGAAGCRGWRTDYERLDVLRGKRIVVHRAGGTALAGTAVGTDELGALLVRDDRGTTHRCFGGELSVRPP